jgi:hypothetical protein
MSDDDSIFLGTDEPVAQVADWLSALLGLEPIPEQPDAADELGLRGPAATVDGWLGVLVHRNWHAQSDPAPDEVQAIDPYPLQLDIWYGANDEEVQQRESRLVFDRLVAARPDVAMLLCHNLTILVAAHLPGVGTQYFEPDTTLDAPDIEKWRPWVPHVSL